MGRTAKRQLSDALQMRNHQRSVEFAHVSISRAISRAVWAIRKAASQGIRVRVAGQRPALRYIRARRAISVRFRTEQLRSTAQRTAW